MVDSLGGSSASCCGAQQPGLCDGPQPATSMTRCSTSLSVTSPTGRWSGSTTYTRCTPRRTYSPSSSPRVLVAWAVTTRQPQPGGSPPLLLLLLPG